jgi:hypothetical protein
MNPQQLRNEPVKLLLGGVPYAVRRPSAFAMNAAQQAAYLARCFQDIADKAAGPEATRKALDDIPMGLKFIEAASEYDPRSGNWMNEVACACIDADTKTAESALANATESEIQVLTSFLFQSRKRVHLTDGEIDDVVEYMAERYGYSPEQTAALTDEQLCALYPPIRKRYESLVVARARAKAEAMNKEQKGADTPCQSAEVPTTQ